MSSDEATVARQHAEAVHALQSVLQRAGPAATSVAIDEIEHTSWGVELGFLAADVALTVLTSGTHDASGPDTTKRFTGLTAYDAQGRPLAMVRGHGWCGREMLPALAQWARQTGRAGVWRNEGHARVVIDGRLPLGAPPGPRPAGHVVAELAARGWQCAHDASGVTLSRARTGRDWVSVAILVVLCTALFPLMAVVGLVLVYRRLTRGRWDVTEGTVRPWERADERLELRVAPGSLALRRTQNGRPVAEHRWDASSLLAVFARPTGSATSSELCAVEPDRVRALPVTLRGEVGARSDVAELLTELVVAVWSGR